jgi:hypothetical protein
VVVPPTDGSTATRPATPALPSGGAGSTPQARQATAPSGLRGHPTEPVPTGKAEDTSATPVSNPKTQHASTGAGNGADTADDKETGDGGPPGDAEVGDDSRVAGDGGPDREPASSLDD